MKNMKILAALALLITGTILTACNDEVVTPEIPDCVKSEISITNTDADRPQKVYRYVWNGDVVYYLEMPCCDQMGKLLDAGCNLICHPDGGITGNGDGICPEFFNEAESKELIWEEE